MDRFRVVRIYTWACIFLFRTHIPFAYAIVLANIPHRATAY